MSAYSAEVIRDLLAEGAIAEEMQRDITKALENAEADESSPILLAEHTTDPLLIEMQTAMFHVYAAGLLRGAALFHAHLEMTS
jgi:mannose/cellobiose epimerase-like protein (N-acyl-D-glucosamine 2-epimerase family)